MKYYWLYSDDEPNVNWVIFCADPNRRLRERYKSLACSECDRVDELEALSLGFDPDVCVRSKLDYFASDEGYHCVSKRGRNILEESGAIGVEFVPLPNEEHFIIVPTHRVHVERRQVEIREEQVMDLEAVARDPRLIATARKKVRVEVDSCGMEFRGKCQACCRCFETLYWPSLSSMALPHNTSIIVSPDIMSEKSWHSVAWLLATEHLVDALLRVGLRGLEPLEAT